MQISPGLAVKETDCTHFCENVSAFRIRAGNPAAVIGTRGLVDLLSEDTVNVKRDIGKVLGRQEDKGSGYRQDFMGMTHGRIPAFTPTPPRREIHPAHKG